MTVMTTIRRLIVNHTFKILLAITLALMSFFLLCCGRENGNDQLKATNDSPQYSPGEDYNVTALSSYPSGNTIAAAPEGFYFIYDYFIFYFDFTKMSVVPLCDKANCLHHQEEDPERVPECGAFIGSVKTTGHHFIGYFNGKLYVTVMNIQTKEHELQLLEMNADGSERKILLEDCTAVNTDMMRIHRGILYYLCTEINLDGDKEYRVKAMELKDADPKEKTLLTIHEKDTTIQQLMPYGNYIYVDYDRKEGSGSNIDYLETILRYDIHNGKTDIIAEEDHYQICGTCDNAVILKKQDGFYFLDNTQDEVNIQPFASGIGAFQETHPGWAIFVDCMGDDAAFLSCVAYSADTLDLIRDMQVIDEKGQLVCEIPDEAHKTGSSEIIRYEEERYFINYSRNMDGEYIVAAYRLSDLMKGVVEEIPVLRRDEYRENRGFIIPIPKE